MKQLQSGRSMIEMLGILAIIGVLSVGGIAGYSKAMEKFKINKTIDQIAHIVTNVRTLYAQQTSYEGLNGELAFSLDLIPEELGSVGSCTTDTLPTATPFCTPFSRGFVVNSGRDGSYFYILYEVHSIEECIVLASADWGNIDSSGLIGMTIGEISMLLYGDFVEDANWDDTLSFTEKSLPLPVASAAQYCQELWVSRSNTTAIGLVYQ